MGGSVLPGIRVFLRCHHGPVGARRISVGERRARLARRHRLVPSTRTDDVAAIADSVVALHSSDPVSVFLSVLARMRHPSIAAVEAALYDSPYRDPVPRDAAHPVGCDSRSGADGPRILDDEAVGA